MLRVLPGAFVFSVLVIASICYVHDMRNHAQKTKKEINPKVLIVVAIVVFVVSMLAGFCIISPEFRLDVFNKEPSSEDRIAEERRNSINVLRIFFSNGTAYSDDLSSSSQLVTLSPQNEYVVTASYDFRMTSTMSTFYIPKDKVLDIIPTNGNEEPTLKIVDMTQYWENPQGEKIAKTKTTKYVLILPQETIDELESLTTTGS